MNRRAFFGMCAFGALVCGSSALQAGAEVPGSILWLIAAFFSGASVASPDTSRTSNSSSSERR